MYEKRLLIRLLLVCAASILFPAAEASATTDSVWGVSLDCPIRFLITTPENTLLAFTDFGVCAIETMTGRTLWECSDFGGDVWAYCGIVPDAPYAIICYGDASGRRGDHSAAPSDPSASLVIRNHLAVVDYLSGTKMWDSRSVGAVSCLGHFPILSAKALMLFYENETVERRTMAVTYKTGEILWQSDLFFPPDEEPPLILQPNGVRTLLGNQPPLFDTDSTMITFMDKHSIRKWNALTGDLIWESAVEAGVVPAISDWYAPMVLDSARGVFYAACDKTLLAVSVVDGSQTWATRPALVGRVHQIFLTPGGILIKGGGNQQGSYGVPFVTLLDFGTGEPVWSTPFRELSSQTNVILRENEMVAYGQNRLFAISLEDGSFRELTAGLYFDGGESPQALELTDRGYLLLSSQNLTLIDTVGRVTYHTYHKMPGRDEIGIVDLIYSVWVGGIVIGPLITGIRAAVLNAPPTGHPRQQDLITGLPCLGTTTFAKNNVYMLATVKDFIDFRQSKSHRDKGTGLIKIDKVWGEVACKVILKDMNPVYTLNASEDRLFVARHGTRLICYWF